MSFITSTKNTVMKESAKPSAKQSKVMMKIDVVDGMRWGHGTSSVQFMEPLRVRTM